MRWIGHLLGALLVGVIVIVLWEQFSGVSISQEVSKIFSGFGVGPGLMIAILALAALIIWARSSSN